MSNLFEALAAGATIVTPNNRLARDVAARFDHGQRDSGRRAWTTADALPFTLWLDRLWRAVLATGALRTPPVLLDASSTRALWHAIVAQHRHDWLNARGAARHAADAWTTFHRYREPGESIAGIASDALHDDPVVFAQWAQRYESRLRALDAIDDAQLPDVLAASNAALSRGASAPVILHGFMALTPQQRRLVAALRAAGMTIDESREMPDMATLRLRAGFATPRDELVQAFGYARERLLRQPDARIAIVVADLDERRSEALALAEEVLCPEHLLAIAPDAVRPYGISLGEPLSGVPLVATALDLIALAAGRVDATTATSIVRTPFLPDAATHWTRRAHAEQHWLELGLRDVAWPEVLAALREVDPALHRRFAAIAPPAHGLRAPRDWAGAWSDWLAALGWPGSATLTSAEWQARDAWSAALARFASIGSVTGRLSSVAALDALRALLTETLFQPEAAPAPVQILGLLEAAGLVFDCAWLAGFDAQRWPGTAAANPLLPLRWQQARRVPRAHPEVVMEHACAMTSVLQRIAPEIIVSHATTIDDAPAVVSPLFADWPALADAPLLAPLRITDLVPAARMDSATEPAAPPLAAGATMRGGAGLFDSQSACAFQAFARYRLDARPWPSCPDGLSPAERGEMLHATLKAFWDATGDQSTLAALDPHALALRIADAVEAGKARIGAPRWRTLAPAVANAEASRLAATLHAWIDEGERTRPPFRVRGHEQRIGCSIDDIALSLRVDRIDELPGGGLAVIDYKSGNVVPPARWFAERPEGIQVAIYAMAVESAAHEPVRALVYAQVKAGDIDVAGLAEDNAQWPALAAVDSPRLALAGWADARAQLAARVHALASDIRDGIADVAPRTQAICGYCGLQPLCRVQRLDDGASAEQTRDE